MTDETQDLDTILGINASGQPRTPQDEVDLLAVKLLSVNEQIEALKAVKESIEDAIWTRTPDEVGDHAVDGTQYSFTVSRSEQWKWDSNKIESKISTVPLPPHVKAKYSIDKKMYKAMSAQDQQDWIDTLEVKPSRPKISVSKKV